MKRRETPVSVGSWWQQEKRKDKIPDPSATAGPSNSRKLGKSIAQEPHISKSRSNAGQHTRWTQTEDLDSLEATSTRTLSPSTIRDSHEANGYDFVASKLSKRGMSGLSVRDQVRSGTDTVSIRGLSRTIDKGKGKTSSVIDLDGLDPNEDPEDRIQDDISIKSSPRTFETARRVSVASGVKKRRLNDSYNDPDEADMLSGRTPIVQQMIDRFNARAQSMAFSPRPDSKVKRMQPRTTSSRAQDDDVVLPKLHSKRAATTPSFVWQFALEQLFLGERGYESEARWHLAVADERLELKSRMKVVTEIALGDGMLQALEFTPHSHEPFLEIRLAQSSLCKPMDRTSESDTQRELRARCEENDLLSITVVPATNQATWDSESWSAMIQHLRGKMGPGSKAGQLDNNARRSKLESYRHAPTFNVYRQKTQSSKSRLSDAASENSAKPARIRPRPSGSHNIRESTIDSLPPRITRAAALAERVNEPIDLDAEDEDLAEAQIIPPSSDQPPAKRTRRRRESRQEPQHDISVVGDKAVSHEVMLVFPPEGVGAVTVTGADFARLDDGEFLNDTLIEYGLKRIYSGLTEEVQNEVHIFNSFFYKKLQYRDKKNRADKSERELAAYESIKKWTSKFDLFSKRFIVIPINEHLHWYLAVIVNPAAILREPRDEVKDAIAGSKVKIKGAAAIRRSARHSNIGAASMHTSKPSADQNNGMDIEIVTDPTRIQDNDVDEMQVDETPADLLVERTAGSVEQTIVSLSDKQGEDKVSQWLEGGPTAPFGTELSAAEYYQPAADTSERAADESNELSIDAKRMSRSPTPSRKGKRRLSRLVPDARVEDTLSVTNDGSEGFENPNIYRECCLILTFDSLGANHSAVGKHLMTYLTMEALDKGKATASDRIYTVQASRILSAWDTPVQPNYCDCGLYLLHFVYAFLNNPEPFIQSSWERNKAKWRESPHWQREVLTAETMRQTWRDDILKVQEEYRPIKAQKEAEAQAERTRRHLAKLGQTNAEAALGNDNEGSAVPAPMVGPDDSDADGAADERLSVHTPGATSPRIASQAFNVDPASPIIDTQASVPIADSVTTKRQYGRRVDSDSEMTRTAYFADRQRERIDVPSEEPPTTATLTAAEDPQYDLPSMMLSSDGYAQIVDRENGQDERISPVDGSKGAHLRSRSAISVISDAQQPVAVLSASPFTKSGPMESVSRFFAHNSE